jgi:hypothetical protein
MRATVIPLSPFSGGLVMGRREAGRMRRYSGAIKANFVEAD